MQFEEECQWMGLPRDWWPKNDLYALQRMAIKICKRKQDAALNSAFHAKTILPPDYDREQVVNQPSLYFVEYRGHRYAVIEQNCDDAMGCVEWLGAEAL